MAAVGGDARKDGSHGILANAPGCELPRQRIGAAIVETGGKSVTGLADAGRSHEVGGGDEERATGHAVVVIEHATQFFPQGGFRARLKGEFRRRAGGRRRRGDVGGSELGCVRPGSEGTGVQPVAGRAQLRSQRLDGGPACLEGLADMAECFPVALLYNGAIGATAATLHGSVTARQRHGALGQQGGDGRVESAGAQVMAGAVGGAAFDTILPALDGAVDDGGRLAVVEGQGETLGQGDLLPRESVGHIDDIPVVKVGQFRGRPLHIVAGCLAVATDPVRVDGRLVPIDMEDDIAE